jgi:hypothetical protein
MQVFMTFFLYQNFSVRELNKVCLQRKRPYLTGFWMWTTVTVRVGCDVVWLGRIGTEVSHERAVCIPRAEE